ncbi:MAG: TetR/AcrR family transcriptional regulator [Rhodospirillaceae bacterium]|nr:TetR/AcrR family transcriptional regulator [Rhodospirillaceae bacterium]
MKSRVQKIKPAPRRRREPRIRAIVDAAEQVFLEQGYEAGSLDEIAARANASKATIYAHFGNKVGLFKVIVGEKLAQAAEPLRKADEAHASVPAALTAFGHSFLSLLLSPGPLKIYRLMVAQGEQFPELAQMWFENGPKVAIATLASFLRAHADAGDLELDDPEQAAEFFLMMMRGRLHICAVSGLSKPPYDKDIKRCVAAAVDMFMRAYGPPAFKPGLRR